MVYHFAIILNNLDIIFSSSSSSLPKFEIAQFTNLLLEQIDLNNQWNLHKIIFKTLEEGTLKLLVRQNFDPISKNRIHFCILSDFSKGSAYGYELLDRFLDHFLKEYPLEKIHENLDEEKRDEIKSLGMLLYSTMFGSSYENFIERVSQKEEFCSDNKILYMGLSTTDGIPIISTLYPEGTKILNVNDENRKEYIKTVLSGQLATISMNAIVRAQTYLNSIQVRLADNENQYLFFDFANLGVDKSYVFEIITMGNPEFTIQTKNEIAEIIETYNVVQNPFVGQIKSYVPLREIFDEHANVSQ